MAGSGGKESEGEREYEQQRGASRRVTDASKVGRGERGQGDSE